MFAGNRYLPYCLPHLVSIPLTQSLLSQIFTPLSHLVNLKLIPFYKNRYGCLVGYSGHEQNIEPSVVAASLGAEYIERHITTDHNMWGTDQKASLEISAMDMLKRRIDDAILAMGNGIKTITPSEMGVIKKLRG